MVSLDEANKQGLVVGLKDINGIKERLDIDVLMFNYPDTFNLLILALLELKGEKVPWSIDPGFVVNKTDKMSFYQIAGIHGLPRAPWDGEQGRKPDKSGDPGYCTHGLPSFASWHRPYLAMLEQALYRQAANIVDRFNRSTKLSSADKAKYKTALENFRLPYYDYYRPRGGKTAFTGLFQNGKTVADYDYHVPLIFTTSQVMAKTLPDNEFVPVDNPFFNYHFAMGDLDDSEWKSVPSFKPTDEDRKRTCRWGGDNPDKVALLNSNVNKVREDQMRVVLVMIEDKGDQANKASYTNFLNFSTNGIGLIQDLQKKDPKKFFVNPLFGATGSIEGVHDNYHCYLGGFDLSQQNNIKIGHMMCVPIAAFDPIFWFHHCNIDRYFAIWQAVNPTHWFDDIPADHKIPKTDKLSHWRDLHNADQLPFRKAPIASPQDKNSKWEFWSPDTAQKTETFGYRYPDLDPKKYADPEQIREAFAARYGWNRRLQPWQEVGDVPEDMKPLDVQGKAQCFRFEKAPPDFEGVLPPVLTAQVSSLRTTSKEAKEAFFARPEATVSQEYFIDTVVEKMARNGAFTIFLFVGEVTGNSASEWTALPSYVGVAHIFAAPVEACDNCGLQAQNTDRVTNTMSMTSLLLDYVELGQLASMDPEDVKPFLVKNLRWKIQDANGVVVSGQEMSNEHSFRIGVSLKTSPLPGLHVPMGEDGPAVEIDRGFQDVIQDIIDNSATATAARAGGS